MATLSLIHWNAAEAQQRIALLNAAGHDVVHFTTKGPDLLQEARQAQPDAFVIDLGRLPSHGRELAISLRHHKSTRYIPLVFVGGAPDKVARIRDLLPDATYTDWDSLPTALGDVLEHPLVNPVVPNSIFDQYAGRPVAAKLGIKAGSTVALVNPPDGFAESLDDLPENVRFVEGLGEVCSLSIWFIGSYAELLDSIAGIASHAGHGPVWVAWPKKSSGVRTDLGQAQIRDACLECRLVDYKVCSIDTTWSALLFRRRREEENPPSSRHMRRLSGNE